MSIGDSMTKRIGVYIHIPFCTSKCAYCDFYSLAGVDERRMAQYHHALILQIKESAPTLSGYLVDTVYFGGGTPSYYGAERIIELFDALKDHCKVLIDSEVTVEVNPGSISCFDLKLLQKAGVNRLSIGVQTTDDGLNESLGRRHSFDQAERTVEDARLAGFDNISLDLIYGLPSQSRLDWANTLQKTMKLKPEHLSCYGLRIEENTPLYLYKDSPQIPNEDDCADMYLYAVDALRDLGFRQYEISNFCLPGKESRHNLKYWQLDEYIGFGPSAHAYVGGTRYSYVSDIGKYLDGLKNNTSILAWCEHIPKSEQAVEYLMLGLRTTRGITAEEYYAIYQSSFEPLEVLLHTYAKNGWAHLVNGRWSFTPMGFLLSNQLIGDIIDAHAAQRVSIGMPWKNNSQ